VSIFHERDSAHWVAVTLDEIRILIGRLVEAGGGPAPDPRPPWDRESPDEPSPADEL